MSKNAEGWIRHRGGKCPVEAGTEVSTRHRDGKIVEVHHMTAFEGASAESLKCVWSHENDDNDIMAYRLHKPAEQVEACSKPDPRDPAKRDSDYVCWMRDRITEIDATTQALTTERAELVQKLAGGGFALIGRVVEPVEDMSDWRNWIVGDLLSVVSNSVSHGFDIGETVVYSSALNDDAGCGRCEKLDGTDFWVMTSTDLKFHSRPSA